MAESPRNLVNGSSNLNNQALLHLEAVTKHFGGISALNQVSFTVKPGQIKGLIGPNGAGKTTCFNLIAGVFPLSAGRIFFENKPITGLSPYQIARSGIARTFQNVRLFPNLTVLENVLVGFHQKMKSGFVTGALHLPWTVKEEADYNKKAQALLNTVGLGDLSSVPAAVLPFGQQRLLEVARALATEPRLLLLDEPAAGLSNPERVFLLHTIKSIRDSGVTILLVEHDIDLVMKVCDEIVVLEFGSKIAEGDPKSIRSDRRVVTAYLGEDQD